MPPHHLFRRSFEAFSAPRELVQRYLLAFLLTTPLCLAGGSALRNASVDADCDRTHHAAIMPLAPLCNQVQPRAVAHSSAPRCVLLSHEICIWWSAQDWWPDTSRYACRDCVTSD